MNNFLVKFKHVNGLYFIVYYLVSLLSLLAIRWSNKRAKTTLFFNAFRVKTLIILMNKFDTRCYFYHCIKLIAKWMCKKLGFFTKDTNKADRERKIFPQFYQLDICFRFWIFAKWKKKTGERIANKIIVFQ